MLVPQCSLDQNEEHERECACCWLGDEHVETRTIGNWSPADMYAAPRQRPLAILGTIPFRKRLPQETLSAPSLCDCASNGLVLRLQRRWSGTAAAGGVDRAMCTYSPDLREIPVAPDAAAAAVAFARHRARLLADTARSATNPRSSALQFQAHVPGTPLTPTDAPSAQSRSKWRRKKVKPSSVAPVSAAALSEGGVDAAAQQLSTALAAQGVVLNEAAVAALLKTIISSGAAPATPSADAPPRSQNGQVPNALQLATPTRSAGSSLPGHSPQANAAVDFSSLDNPFAPARRR